MTHLLCLWTNEKAASSMDNSGPDSLLEPRLMDLLWILQETQNDPSQQRGGCLFVHTFKRRTLDPGLKDFFALIMSQQTTVNY